MSKRTVQVQTTATRQVALIFIYKNVYMYYIIKYNVIVSSFSSKTGCLRQGNPARAIAARSQKDARSTSLFKTKTFF